jgi:hypothetical protein
LPEEVPKHMVIRGMKVAFERNYNSDMGAYSPRSDGRKTLEPTTKMAFEDISELNWFEQ